MDYGILEISLTVHSAVSNSRVDRAVRYVPLRQYYGSNIVGVLCDWEKHGIEGLFQANTKYRKAGAIRFRPEEGHAYLKNVELEVHDKEQIGSIHERTVRVTL